MKKEALPPDPSLPYLVKVVELKAALRTSCWVIEQLLEVVELSVSGTWVELRNPDSIGSRLDEWKRLAEAQVRDMAQELEEHEL